MAQRVNCVQHAVLADRLSVMRDRATPHGVFRQAVYEASAIMAVEVARELPVKEVDIETPLETTRGLRLRDEIAVVPVLRAGLGMVEGFLRLVPDARVGHLGIQRDHEDHAPDRLLRTAAAADCPTSPSTCWTRCSPPGAARSGRCITSSARARATSSSSASSPRPRGWPR